MVATRVYEVGERYGRLTVIERRATATKYVRVQCDCGAELDARPAAIACGNTTSCGCVHREQLADRNRSHGLADTPIYWIWQAMISRTSRETDPGYPNYGGRGITVCQRWQTFENFYADMGERPADRSLDRIDNDGNYEPGNCRWATRSEQNANKRTLTHCKRGGHEYTEENTYWTPDGYRMCRTCRTEHKREQNAELKAQRARRATAGVRS